MFNVDYFSLKGYNQKPKVKNTGMKWYNTYYGKYCDDDVIITGECDRNYYCVWLDKDVSDCCIMKVSKEHYETLEEFNEAVVKYFEKELTYKIRPIRKPRGWFRW